jgi:hypothetical protein
MMKGDHMSLAEASHAAGMVLLLAFSCAFILSARAAIKPTERIELSDLVQRLVVDTASPAPKWGEIPSRLGVRWLDSTAPTAPPVGMDMASVSKHMAVPIKIGGQPARYSTPAGKRSVEGWGLSFYGTDKGPAALVVSGGDLCDKPCSPVNLDLESALRTANLSYALECQTKSARHLRVMLDGKRTAYAAQYEQPTTGKTQILFFWSTPPAALLRQDGCMTGGQPSGV